MVIQHIMGGHKRDCPTGIPLHNGSTTSLLSCTLLSLLEEERWLIGEGLAHGELSHRRDRQVLVWTISSHLEERPAWKTALFAEIETAADAAFNPSTFGESLDVTLRLQERNYPNEKIPVILPFLADGILVPGGMKCEGIFCVPGDSDLVSQLKLRIDRGYYTLENVDNPHMLASLLKLWLRPDSPACVTIVRKLPTINRRVVLFVMSFLQLFLEEKALARLKMTATNMALVLSPNLLGCSPQSMTVVFMNAQFKQTFVYNLLSAMELMKTMYRPLHPNLVSPNLAIGDEADIGLHQDLLGLHSQKWTLSMPLAPYIASMYTVKYYMIYP
ncbi:Rho GTPase activation protein [Pisolithus marmoratus]|nr:Rho GTPase activation protein [Pisolithus marmoratus]